MKQIAVLMSTYNGERFLREQIDSILFQNDVDVQLYIRDDGSADGTRDILREYEKKENVHVKYGHNLGVIRAYEKLILMAPKRYSYYAFSDQDDIWYRNKLSTALQKLEVLTSAKKPLLYCCNQNCVNEKGEFLYKRLPDELLQTNVIHSMLDNQYSGCTMVFNKTLLEKVQYTYRVSGKSLRAIYDHWFMAIAQILGTVVYDNEAYIDFRRHGNNATQAAFSYTTSISETKSILKRQFRNLFHSSYFRGYTKYRCKLLIECFSSEMSEMDKRNLQYMAHYDDSLFLYLRNVVCSPLRHYYRKPKWVTWMRFVLRMY